MSDKNVDINPTIAKLSSNPKDPHAPPENVRRFAGYFGPSAMDGSVRLYLSLGDLSTYLEIQKDQIVHSEKVPESVMDGEACYVWVKQDAMVTVATSRPAALVDGDISSHIRAENNPFLGFACAGTRGTCPPPVVAPSVICPSVLTCFLDSSRRLFEVLQGRG